MCLIFDSRAQVVNLVRADLATVFAGMKDISARLNEVESGLRANTASLLSNTKHLAALSGVSAHQMPPSHPGHAAACGNAHPSSTGALNHTPPPPPPPPLLGSDGPAGTAPTPPPPPPIARDAAKSRDLLRRLKRGLLLQNEGEDGLPSLNPEQRSSRFVERALREVASPPPPPARRLGARPAP